MKVAVAIPTYKCPAYLRRPVALVIYQTRRPDELLLVSRIDDESTNETIRQIIMECGSTHLIRNITVEEPGFLPPVKKAIAEAGGDILVLLDDDAEAHPDWLARIVEYYSDEAIGGVGGRYINYFSGVLQHYPPVSKVAKLSWFGRSVGNMYCECNFKGPVEADFLIGGNMSYRLNLLRRCQPDGRIGNNVAFHWEMDVGLQVKRLGCRIIFDPAIKVDHHTAPREAQGLRSFNYEGVYWANYNYALLMRKHLPFPHFVAYIIYTSIVGGTGSPGLVYLLAALARRKEILWKDVVVASARGRLAGFFS